MDGRILIKHHPAGPGNASIPELTGWTPEAATIHAGGPVAALESLSLIIPTFFNTELKHRSLRHLLAGLEQSGSLKEIILVASDGEKKDFDDLQEQLQGRPVRVVESDPHNRGKSRNAGAAVASARHLLFLDDDMLVRNWRSIDVILSRMLSAGQDCALFPRRHYAKFPLLFDPPTLQTAINTWRRTAGAGENPFLYDPLTEGARDLPMLFCFPGCFMLIRREVFQGMGGFNEEFIGWGFEDTEFGLRALRELRVLNLFRQGEPLLHIDHPVSPYKSDEHNANYKKFNSASANVDVNLFCRAVFRGEDFQPDGGALRGETLYLEPFRRLAHRGIPVDVESEPTRSWCLTLARQRMSRCLSPLPRFIALHGSRAEGDDESDDDYDVLSLYHGTIQEFFVSDGNPRVELECADIYRFEHIATHPAMHSFQGPMELAKIANARLLWGDTAMWRDWSSGLIKQAMDRGWCFWLVFGLGLHWHVAKYGPMVERYFSGLQKLRAYAADSRSPQANGQVDLRNRSTVVHLAREALHRQCPDWRERLAAGEAIFELQVPEVWIALHRLSKMRNGHTARTVSRLPETKLSMNGAFRPGTVTKEL